jgi:hypothetical protein
VLCLDELYGSLCQDQGYGSEICVPKTITDPKTNIVFHGLATDNVSFVVCSLSVFQHAHSRLSLQFSPNEGSRLVFPDRSPKVQHATRQIVRRLLDVVNRVHLDCEVCRSFCFI